MMATKPDDKDVVSVTGMGLTWTAVASLNQCGARGQLEGYVYTATGDGGSNGVVTANLADAPTTSAIVVHRITGQHATAPIQATQTANTNGEGGACSGGTDATPWDVDETSLYDDSLLLGFAASKSNKAPYTVDAPWVDIGYETTIDSGSDVAIQYSSRTTTTAGLFNFGGDWDADVDWTAHWIEVRATATGGTPAYPRPNVWAQLDADTTARWQRSRSGEPGTYWLQTPDFGDIGSIVVTDPSFRVVTYELKSAANFTGTTHTLTLNQDLAADYFVLMRGAAGNYSSGTDWNPDDNYARVTQDPFGNFTAGSSAANQLELARGAVGNVWTGQVTVVECIADCAASGFTLVRANEVTMTSGQTSATDTTGAAWGSGNLGQIGLYGGSYGGGVQTTEFGVANHKTAWARIWPSGSDTVNLSRSNTGPGEITGTTEFSVYVVQWGSDWTIQRANVTGSNGGDGMNLTTHYNTASINSVNRADTWVIAYGQVDGNSLDAGWDGQSWTLGDGVNQNTTETLVAVGSEAGVQRDVEVYVHTNPDFFNQYVFGPDGVAPGIVTTATSGIATILSPKSTETYNASDTAGRRFIIVANTQNGAGTSFPRSIVWGQLDGELSARWQRSRSGQPGTYWMQTPDFGGIGEGGGGGGGGGGPDLEQLHYRWRNDDGAESGGSSPLQASATADTPAETSGTDVLVPGMTLTPGAGDYLVSFSGSLENSAPSSTNAHYVSLYVNGVQVAHTERAVTADGSLDDMSIPVGFQALVTGVGAADVIEVRWRTDVGSIIMHERTLVVQPITPADVSQATASADTPGETSTTDVLVPGMTLTPGAGDYLVWFSSSVEGSGDDSTQNVSLYVNGSQVAHTERAVVMEASMTDTPVPVMFQAFVTGVGAADVIDVRWRTDAGTMIMHERTLVVHEITPADISQASATADTPGETSTTDVLVPGMTLTPGAGDYLVWFSGSLDDLLPADGEQMYVSLYVNGVQVAHTERQIMNENSLDDIATTLPVMFQAFVTGVGAADTIEARWRTDTGTMEMHERALVVAQIAGSGATWAAAEDTALSGLAKSTTKRLRILISNAGDPSGSVAYRLQVSNPNPVSCADAGTTWTRIDTSTHWDMVTSTHFADGDPTSNITPGLTDPGGGKTFFAGELQESPTDETSGIALSGTQFTEIEYAVEATTSATDGAVYCFRLTDAGNPANFTYTEYGQVTLS